MRLLSGEQEFLSAAARWHPEGDLGNTVSAQGMLLHLLHMLPALLVMLLLTVNFSGCAF